MGSLIYDSVSVAAYMLGRGLIVLLVASLALGWKYGGISQKTALVALAFSLGFACLDQLAKSPASFVASAVAAFITIMLAFAVGVAVKHMASARG